MPSKLFDKDGKEVDAFTQEELDAQKKEAIVEHLKNNPDKSAEVTKLQGDIDELTKKLEDAGMPVGQKERLKAAKDAAEAKLAETVTALTKEISDLKETFTGSIKNKAIEKLSKGDPDIKAKLELKYTSLMKTGDYKNDEAGILQAMTEAATLVTGSKPVPGFMDNISGAGQRGDLQTNKNEAPESENAKTMRQAFNIPDAAAEKYKGQIK